MQVFNFSKILQRLFLPLTLALALVTVLPEMATGGELPLAQPLVRELNLVLKASDSLHKSLLTQNEEMIEFGLRDMLWQIDRVRGVMRTAKPHERGHLIRILQAAYDQLELTQSAFGEERRLRLEEAFNQLVNLVRIYRLDRSYSIFFCPRDRTTWVQKGLHPRNPFHLDAQRESCGIRVPN